MKVLYLAPDRTRDDRITGMTFIDEEIEALVASGVEAHVLSLHARTDQVIRGVHVHAVPSGRSSSAVAANLAFFLRHASPSTIAAAVRSYRNAYVAARVERFAAELIDALGVQLIHSHFGFPAGVGGVLAARATNVPLVASFRGMDLLVDPSRGYGLRLDPLHDRAIRYLLRTATHTTYISGYMKQTGILLGAPVARATVVRKGVRLDVFRPEAGGEVAKAAEILCVCNLLPRKRVDHLIHAVALLGTELDFRLTICGTGPEDQRLRALASELGLADRTHFRGWIERSDIPALFARATVLVLPTIEEAAGNVLLEAQAAGTPAICMRSGGAPEYVLDGETGFVVDVEDAEALAQRIRLLLTDVDTRTRMSAAARSHAESALGYERMIGGILSVYDQTISKRVFNGASLTVSSGR